jgi:ABC-2 type transport system permease protein
MLKLLFADLKMLFRNKQALFWVLMFPLMFTLIFGLFFGKSNNIVGAIVIVNKSDTELSKSLDKGLVDSNIFNIKNESDLVSAKKEVEKNKISAVVYIPEKFGTPLPDAPKNITIYYDPSSAQAVSILSSFVDKYLTGASFAIQQAKPIFSIDQEKIGSNKPYSYFDFVMAGLLGLALMNASIMGMAVAISKYKEDKILKRITTTPLKTWKFLASQVISRLVLNVIQIALILSVVIHFFNGHVYGNLWVLVVIALLGAVLFQLIGFVMAGFAKTADAAQGMAQAVAIPMMFLAGVFFPIDALPKWLFNIVQFLPLAPLLRMLRGISIDAVSPFSNPLNIEIIIGWIVIMFLLALWKFRLSEE